ncbi:TIGR04222 domain-containing membrane protein [Amycolatopsis taiwanensis]|uniref:TIGR04222 domain-containing membrane protein n=1 Tax=Amycolatopsis taiwanensis TaxID=342230 RepID=A0A9W6R6Q1_9PSEU|nr:TIGR04222 domain-containing membrane protein [Amycolatopsis taiwanensis]GLY69733.1 hypothetical protein Atai01_63520 [Amycolatopsis taiwanensis]
MNEPWGISGPEFLAIYACLLALPVVLMLGWLVALRGRPATIVAPLPSAYHYAYLIGGPDRVVDTATATLIDQEHLRVDSRGRLTAIGRRPPSEPLAAEIWRSVRENPSRPVFSVRANLGRHSLVTRIGADLVNRGMVVPKVKLTDVWWTVVVLYALVLTLGIVRMFNGLVLERPVGYLQLLIVLATLLTITALGSRRRFTTTVTARGAQARQAAQAGQVALLTGVVGAVVVGGLPEYPDPEIGAAFVPSPGWSGSTGGSGCSSVDSGSSCGSSSGSSCGGGGCGG